MLKINDIEVNFKKNNKIETVIKNFTLQAAPGEITTIIGDNGVGKSSILNVINGCVNIQSGSIKYNNVDIHNLSIQKRVKFIATISQDAKLRLLNSMTINENLSFAYTRGRVKWLLPFDQSKCRKYFANILESFDIKYNLNDKVDILSGGEKQMLNLLMAEVMQDKKILLLDEITSALNFITAEKMMLLLSQMVIKNNLTAVMTTHDLDQALRFSDKIFIMQKNKPLRLLIKENFSNMNYIELQKYLH